MQKKLEIKLDFISEFDDAKLQAAAKKLQAVLDGIDLSGIDPEQMAQDVATAFKALEEKGVKIPISADAGELLEEVRSVVDAAQNRPIDMPINLKAEAVEQSISEAVQSLVQLLSKAKDADMAFQKLNVDELEAQLKNIGGDELEKIKAILGGLTQSSGEPQVLNDLANGYRKAKAELETLAKTQQDALAALKVTGREGTVEFEELRSELEKTVSSLEQLQDASRIELGQVDVDPVEELANTFRQAKAELQSLEAKQKDALSALKMLGKEGSAEYQAIEEELKDVQEQLGKMDGVAEKVTSSFERLGQVAFQINNIQQAVASGYDSLFGGLQDSLNAGYELNTAINDLSIKTGAYGAELEGLKKAAEDAFLLGVGGSVAEATKIIGNAQVALGDVFNPEEIGDFTSKAQAIATLFDADVNEVLTKSTTLVKQFGLSSEEAFNAMSLAFENGGTAQNDVLDSLSEYSQLAVKAGESAESFAYKLSIAGKEGAFNTDKIADSLKEAQIRIMAGDFQTAFADIEASTSGAAKSVVQDVKAIVQAGQDGTLTISEVLKKTTDAIEGGVDSGAISEKLRSQLQVAIAGTPAEDLGADLYAKVFGADVPQDELEAKARTAGEQFSGVLGQYTTFEAGQRKFDLFVEKVGLELVTFSQSFANIFGDGVVAAASGIDAILPRLANLASMLPLLEQGGTFMSAFGTGIEFAKGKFDLLSKALVANPWVGALTVAVSLMALFLTKTETGQKIMEKLGEYSSKAFDELVSVLEDIGAAISNAITYVSELYTAFEEVAGSVGTLMLSIANPIALVTNLITGDFQKAWDDVTKAFDEGSSAAAKKINREELKRAAEDAAKDITDALKESAEFEVKIDQGKSLAGLADQYDALNQQLADKKAEIGALEIRAKTDVSAAEELERVKAEFDQLSAKSADVANAIGEIDPKARGTAKAIIDSNGEVIKTYDINIEKVRSLAAEQQKAGGAGIEENQKKIAEGLAKQNALYESNKERLKEVEASLRASNDPKVIEELSKEYEDLTAQTQEMGKAIVANLVQLPESAIQSSGLGTALSDELASGLQSERLAQAAREGGEKVAGAVKTAMSAQGDVSKAINLDGLVAEFEKTKASIEAKEIELSNIKLAGGDTSALEAELAKMKDSANKVAESIVDIAPAAKESAKAVVDAQGNVSYQYDISTEKARQFAEQQRSSVDGNVLQAQQDYLAGLQAQSAQYEANRQRLQEIADEIAKSQDPAQIEKLKAKFQEVQKANEGIAAQLVDSFKDGEKAGLNNAAAVRTIGQAFGKSDEEARALLNTQKSQQQIAEQTTSAIKKLAEAFDAAKKSAGEAADQSRNALAQQINVVKDLEKQLKEASKAGQDTSALKERLKAEKELISTINQRAQEEQNNLDTIAQIEAQADNRITTRQERIEANAKKIETEYAKQVAAMEKVKVASQDLLEAEKAQAELKLRESGRSRTIVDDYNEQVRTLDEYTKQIDAAQKALDEFSKVRPVAENRQAFNEKKKELQTQIDDLKKEADKQGNQISITSKLIPFELKELRKAVTEAQIEARREQLLIDVELGLKPREELFALVDDEFEKAKKKSSELEQQILKTNQAISDGAASGASEEQLAALEIQRLATEQALIEANKLVREKAEERRTIRRDIDEKTLADLERASAKEIAEIERRSARYIDVLVNSSTAIADINRAIADQSLDEKVKQLDAEAKAFEKGLKAQEKIASVSSEEIEAVREKAALEAQKRREAAEEEHRRRVLVIEKQAAAEKLALEEEKARKELEIERKKLDKTLEVINKRIAAEGDQASEEDKNAAQDIRDQLDEINRAIEEKSDSIRSVAALLQEDVQLTMSNLFSGDPEKAKEGFRGFMSTIVGALKQQINAFVLHIVLTSPAIQSIAAGAGILAPLALAGIQQTIAAGVNALASPILNAIASFPTGGRFDEPTLALIGDGNRLGGLNREWLFRDDQLRSVISSSSAMAMGSLLDEMRMMRQDLQAMQFKFKVQGNDLVTAVNRTQANIKSRIR